MMLLKLALRNVRRQIGGYLIYFVTVALTVSLLFSLASLMFSEIPRELSMEFYVETMAVCVLLAALLTIVSALVLGYGTAFLLRRRKKEFGMYLALGMTRGNIVFIFMMELLFTFLFSLAAGLGLGTLVYQLLMAGVSSFLGMDFVGGDFSVGGFVLTVVLVGVVFLLAALVSLAYLRFEKIAKLMQGTDGKKKSTKNPKLWLIVTAVFACVLVLSLIILLSTVSSPEMGRHVLVLVGSAAAAFISIVFVYIGALKCGVYYLLKNKRFSSRGTRTFVLRQISGRISADSALFGVIAVLLSVVIAGGNLFLTAFGAQAEEIRINNPFSVHVVCPYDETGEYTEDVPVWLEELGEVTELRTGRILTGQVSDLGLEDDRIGDREIGIIGESDYLALAEMAGEKADPAGNGYIVLGNGISVPWLEELKGQAEGVLDDTLLEIGEYRLPFNGFSSVRSRLCGGITGNIVLLPDGAADTLMRAAGGRLSLWYSCAVNFKSGTFDMAEIESFFGEKNREALYDEISGLHGPFFDLGNNFASELAEIAAPFLLLLLFVTVAFALLSMAVLALKSLAAVAEDKRRYRLLYLAGASERQTLSALTVNIALWFFLPFAVPILLNIPVFFVNMAVNDMFSGYLSFGQLLGNTALFSGVILLLYALYCAVTCLVARLDVKRSLRASGM